MRTSLIIIVLLLLQSNVGGQVAPGTRLRVTVSSPPQQQIGNYEGRTDSTLLLTAGALPVTVPLANITRLEFSRGRKPSVLGGVAGFIIGFSAGALLACNDNRDSYGVFCGGQNDTKIVLGATLGGLGGAAAGAYLFRRERWGDLDPVRLQPIRP